MNRIEGKLALITGASAGIGEACARRLAAEGADVALWARRKDRLDALAEELAREHGVAVHTAAVDVRDRGALAAAVAALLGGRPPTRPGDTAPTAPADGAPTAPADSAPTAPADSAAAPGPPHILVNNAGLAAGFDPVQAGSFEDWDRMIDTNVKGLLNVTRLLLPSMIEANRGHIINIGSTAGHQVYPKGNVYNATKFAVTALTEAINLDVAGTKLRVSSVDPGFVETEFSVVRFHGDEARADSVYQGFQPLTGDDVADAVAYIANLPGHANVLRMVLVPRAQRNAYIVDREA